MSETPEEQPSPGVLSRIGSWFSPWKGKGPTSPSENASPTSDQVFKSEGEEEESEDSVRRKARGEEQQEETQRVSRDIFLFEGEDATQSARRDSSVVSSTETAGGGPNEVEFAGCRKERTGQGKEREESSNRTSQSGNPKKNASHLTHRSSPPEQGVLWDSDRTHAQPQAPRQAQVPTGKQLHVYLEETSVIHSDSHSAGQEVVTRFKGSLQVLQPSKLSESVDPPDSASSTGTENKRTNVTPAVGAQRYYSAPVGVSRKSHRNTQLDPEPDQKQTEDDDSMGRKNAAKRRCRKNSQGEGGNSPQQDKTPPSAATEGFPTSEQTVTSPQGKSPNTHMGESSLSSSSTHNPSSLASPEGGDGKTSCPESVAELDEFQDSYSTVTAATGESVVDGGANMEEDDDSLYKVERKTETPESKRRSLKVSRSEVKFFPKNVPLKPVDDTKDFRSVLKKTGDDAKNEAKTETDSRQHNLKRIDEEPKQVVGRITDKISLFERPSVGVSKPTFRTQRSADVSPVRNATEQLKANVSLSDQRSRSAERYGMVKSSSASPAREKPMTIKERMKNFTEASKAGERAEMPQKPARPRMPPKPTLSASSKSPELGNQGKQDTREQKQRDVKTEKTSKPDGQDTTDAGVKIITPKEQPTESSTKDTVDSKTRDPGTKANSVEKAAVAKGSSDSTELTISLSPQPKGRTRSKRRKSKEPASPRSPNMDNKLELSTTEPEATTLKAEQVGVTETASASRQPAEKIIPSCDTAEKKTPDKLSLSASQQKAFKNDSKESDKQKKQSDSTFKKEKIDKPLERQGGLAEPSVSKDKLDTAACGSDTKSPIDKESVIVPPNDKKTGGLFSQASKYSGKKTAPSPSPAGEKPIKKPNLKEQEPPAEQPKLNKDVPVPPEPENKEKVKEPNQEEPGQKTQSKNKDTELNEQAESKGMDKLENVENKQTKQAKSKEMDNLKTVQSKTPKQGGSKEAETLEKEGGEKSERAQSIEVGKKVSEKTNQTKKKENEKTQQRLQSDKNTTKSEGSLGGQGFPGTDGAAFSKDERKEVTQLVKNTSKSKTNQQESASEPSVKTSSDVRAQTQHDRHNKPTQKAGVAGTITLANEAASGMDNDKGLLKGEVAAHLQKNSAESRGTEKEPVLTVAEPKTNFVSVEKSENSLDDSCARGANDATPSSSKPIIRVTTADEEGTVTASTDARALIDAQADNMPERENTLPKNNSFSVTKSGVSEKKREDITEKNSAVKSVPSEAKISGDLVKLPQRSPLREESKKPESTSGVTPLKGADKTAQITLDSTASNSPANVVEKTADRTIQTLKNELSSVANGEIAPNLQPKTDKKEPVKSKPGQSEKAPVSPEAKKLTQDSVQRSPMKKLHFPRGLSKDDSATGQDAPSSWLDVDFPKRKLKVSTAKLTSAGSESNLLDTPDDLDDEDFVEKIKKLCAPFSLPPRRPNPYGAPQPPFALPAIKEDRFEKTFDPEEFKFGLSKKKQFSIDTTPSTLAKLQSTEEKPGLKPARASLADRSLLLSSLDTHSRLREKTPVSEEEEVKEEKDDQIKWKSRLQGSCVLSSLSSSILRGKRSGLQTQGEGTNSGDVSPSESPQSSPPPSSQPPPPSPTSAAPLKDSLAKLSLPPGNKEEDQAGEAVVSDSAPPLPSFNDIKLPDYLEKYLPREPKPVQSKQGQEQVRTEATEKMTTTTPKVETDKAMKPVPVLPASMPPRFPEIPPPTHSTPTEHKQLPAQPQGILNNITRTARGFHKRPGKMVLFEKAQFSGQTFEIYRDVADATSLQLSPHISVKVVRGCWVLYQKPDFQGRCIALEEGEIELTNMWAESLPGAEPQNSQHMLIGSIRLAVWDYSIPHIDLFTEPEGRGRVTPYHDDTFETGSFGIPLNTASIQVHSGVWLVFSDPGFQGMVAVLETGVFPFPETWGFSSPFVGSMRPLKIGGFKVENPNEVKALLYDEPGFQGTCLEVDSDVFSFCESEGDVNVTDGVNPDSKKMRCVASLKIIGGLWVGYSHPGFEGQQYILEEGEYLDGSDWGGSEQFLSLRPILADFLSPHLKMFSDRNFGDLGVNIDLSVPVINIDDTGYGLKTQSIDVISGVWVVFEEPGFCGESYILEKGLYGSPEDWGALQPRVASAMPVVLGDFENAAKFKVQLFSDPGFQGTVLALEDSVASLQDGFTVASCKVLAGSWLAFEGQDFSGRMYVLEVGSYPDLRSMGCFNTSSSIQSLQITGFEFSLPAVTVFERVALRGKRVVLTDGSVNLQLDAGCSRVQSVLVEGGMWVLYEEVNYRGAQILLKPGEIHDWHQFCQWRKIGSLRPLLQKQVHFRIRNRQTRLMMSLSGDLDDVKLMRIQETEETDGFEQIWLYQNGHLHCKLLEECCLSPSGSVTMAGSRIGLSPEPQNHLWSITPEGFIRYTPSSDLVLEVKGGRNYDKNQVILNTLDPHKVHQRWDVEII